MCPTKETEALDACVEKITTLTHLSVITTVTISTPDNKSAWLKFRHQEISVATKLYILGGVGMLEKFKMTPGFRGEVC